VKLNAIQLAHLGAAACELIKTKKELDESSQRWPHRVTYELFDVLATETEITISYNGKQLLKMIADS
jgi:hypothetical protein